MELLFNNNLILLYFIVGIGIICYERFDVVQKIMIIYSVSYAAALLDIFTWKQMIVFSAVLLYIYLEYLTEDLAKLKIIQKMEYKVLDAAFLLVFQYYYIWFALSLLCFSENLHIRVGGQEYMLNKALSLLLMIVCIHKTSVQKFAIKSINGVMKIINCYPIYRYPKDEIDKTLFYILADIEDKSYFIRENSYNFLSIEFFAYRIQRVRDYLRSFCIKDRIRKTAAIANHYIQCTKHIRGYSTLEMQLMRNIGLRNGYNCVVRRKIFEFLYSKIFLTSLKSYFKNNYYEKRSHYKAYLLWLYCHVVKTKINGRDVEPMNKAFAPDGKIQKWTKEQMFVAAMGLSNRGVGYYSISPYADIIKKYGMDVRKLYEIAENYENE